jgi:enamine deaminase RidA (YjgF/YER057c/UK114 family)
MTPRARRTIVTPPSLPPPRGFNHGIVVEGGRLLFLAGQDASGSDGRIVAPGELIRQFEQVLANLRAVVETAGGMMTDIVKMNIYVLDRAEYLAQRPALGVVYRRYFGTHYPAMALFEVTGLYNEGAVVEIEGLAVLDPTSSDHVAGSTLQDRGP